MTSNGKKAFERLPRDVVPKNYFISLKPDLKNWTFEGSEKIDIEIHKPTSLITVNSAEIEIQKVECQDQVPEISYNKEEELVHFKFPHALEAKESALSISFTGILNDKMKGFYRSTYKTADGEEKRVACTQFEPVDARRSFPCWDEPDRKATFDIELIVPKGPSMKALSNMPETSREAVDEHSERVRFQRSPIMSTYLLAFVVGDFDYVEAHDKDGVLIRVYTPVTKSMQGQFALEIAVKTLPFYHKYFDIAYPLPKMDLIAIPDFAAGAMENWGLVTYREVALLIDPDHSSLAAKQRVALVVGHELAHQWFGNLVTMEWWTHLWLNEGFASFIEYLCVDFCMPDFNIWTQFVEQDLFRAFDLDSLKTSHPIEVPVGHPDEIDEIFDSISYCKGASIIRMLHGYLGEEAFMKGLQVYLARHKFGNTQTEDLWTALEETSKEPVTRIMSTWTQQMGYPVVTISAIGDGKMTLEQSRFISDGASDETNSQWVVPITVATADRPDEVALRFLLDAPSKTVDISSLGTDPIIKVNVGTKGVYRVCYPIDTLSRLMDNVEKFSALDRLGLANDMFALARAGRLSTADVLRQSLRFKGDNDYTLWCCLTSCLSEVGLLIESCEEGEKLYYSYVRDLMSDIFGKLGWGCASGDKEENFNDKLLRPLVLARMGLAGHSEVVSEAKTRFAKHVSGEQQLIADLRAAIYATVLKYGSEEEFNLMLDLHNNTDLSEEKMRISRSLGRAPAHLTARVLDFALSDKVRLQDTVFVIGSCTSSVQGREETWKFVQKHWSLFLERFSGLFLLGRLVKSACSNFTTEKHAMEIEAFFRENKAPSAERAVEQSVEVVRVNAAQVKRDGDAIMNFLKEKYSA